MKRLHMRKKYIYIYSLGWKFEVLKAKRTAVMLAGKNGHYWCCEVLHIGLKINHKDDNGNTVFFYATEGHFLKTIFYLQKHADPTIIESCNKISPPSSNKTHTKYISLPLTTESNQDNIILITLSG